jgi:hypothetical protein
LASEAVGNKASLHFVLTAAFIYKSLRLLRRDASVTQERYKHTATDYVKQHGSTIKYVKQHGSSIKYVKQHGSSIKLRNNKLSV